MTAATLLNELQALGAVLTVNGDRIRVEAPRAAVTPSLRAALVRHKPGVIRLLTDPESHVAKEPFRVSDGDMEFGDIAAGWTPKSWATELRRKADRCLNYRPDIAAYYERWAADIEQRLGSAPS